MDGLEGTPIKKRKDAINPAHLVENPIEQEFEKELRQVAGKLQFASDDHEVDRQMRIGHLEHMDDLAIAFAKTQDPEKKEKFRAAWAKLWSDLERVRLEEETSLEYKANAAKELDEFRERWLPRLNS
jgi:hypothetical protein